MCYMSIRQYYQQHFLLFEFVLSLVSAFILILIFHFVLNESEIESWIISKSSDFYSLLATITGTLLGFVITGVAILLAFPSSERLKELQKSKHYKTIYKVYFSTIYFLALTLILSVVGFLCDEHYAIIIFYLIAWLIIISGLRFWRCVWVLKNVIDIVGKQ